MLRMLCVCLILLALAAALVPLPASWIEFGYSQGVYLDVQRQITSWSNAVPFAVSDALCVAVVAGLCWAIVRFVRNWRTSGFYRAATRAAVPAVAAAAVVYLAFLAMWGLNYRREPLRVRLDFARGRVTPDAALALTRQTIQRVNDLHDEAHAAGWPEWQALPEQLGRPFARVQAALGASRPALPGIPKWSLWTYYFGVSGVTEPFALEVLVDRSMVSVERPFVAAHEWAHLAGYADESEANFIGWLVCLNGPPNAEYSGELDLLIYLLNALPAEERADMIKAVGAGPRQDLREIARHAARAWPALRRPAWWLYDRFLRANRVEQGVRSYGAALELMLGTRFREGWVPARSGR